MAAADKGTIAGSELAGDAGEIGAAVTEPVCTGAAAMIASSTSPRKYSVMLGGSALPIVLIDSTTADIWFSSPTRKWQREHMRTALQKDLKQKR